jgi:hypothetical protein
MLRLDRMPFPVMEIAANRGFLDEPMGTKRKFWFREGEVRWLFKYARPGTGEHWSEKIAAELATALSIPCARVELARTDSGGVGSASRTFLGPNATLVHGNEILQQTDSAYPTAEWRGVKKHTIASVLTSLATVDTPAGSPVPTAVGCFMGYLLLDALIVNVDRHHENWAVIQCYEPTPTRTLAPSYDHASSLGRELLDEQRSARLAGRDKGFTVDGYLRKARSRFYAAEGDAKPLTPPDAFRLARAFAPDAAAFWLAHIQDLRQDVIEDIVHAVPPELMTEPARQFAVEVVVRSRMALVAGAP